MICIDNRWSIINGDVLHSIKKQNTPLTSIFHKYDELKKRQSEKLKDKTENDKKMIKYQKVLTPDRMFFLMFFLP